jgi:hypothetical protein
MKETSRALEAYRIYERLGPQRSTAKVQQELSKSKRLIDEWSRQHAWVERAAAYDAQQAAQAEAEEAEKRRRAREARLGIAANVMSESYKQFMERARDGRLTPYAALQALTLAFETQRKDMGEPDQKVQVAGQIDLSVDVRSLSNVELEAYIGRLQAAISAGGEGEETARPRRAGHDI